jgi:hypothetical protein
VLKRSPKSCTRKEHESATNSIAKRGQGAVAPCRVKGQRPLWGLGQRPNCSSSDQSQGSRQQRCRQRSVPASNFALPQERPQAALSVTCTLSRQMGASDQHREKSFLGAGLFCCREISPLRRRPEGFAVALWTPSHCTPMFLDFSCYRGYRACGRDKSATKQGIPFRERPALHM